jgi:hypothetical protein
MNIDVNNSQEDILSIELHQCLIDITAGTAYLNVLERESLEMKLFFLLRRLRSCCAKYVFRLAACAKLVGSENGLLILRNQANWTREFSLKSTDQCHDTSTIDT